MHTVINMKPVAHTPIPKNVTTEAVPAVCTVIKMHPEEVERMLAKRFPRLQAIDRTCKKKPIPIGFTNQVDFLPRVPSSP